MPCIAYRWRLALHYDQRKTICQILNRSDDNLKKNAEHYIWGNNCDSWILKDSRELSVKQEIMPSGTAEKQHYHNEAGQLFYILQGEAIFYIGEEKFSVKSGESISILPKLKHYISNESAEDLEFLVISSPSTHRDRIETK